MAPGTGGLEVSLDRDAVEGYGPEVTSFSNVGHCTSMSACLVYFIVDNYSYEDGNLADAEAVVTVYRGDRVEATFKIPSNIGTATEYTVFTLDARIGQEKIYAGDRIIPPFLSEDWQGISDWWDTFDGGIWSRVKEGGLLFGLYRSDGNNLHNLEQAKYYTVQDAGGEMDCTEEDWHDTFQSEGWSLCPAGAYMAGLLRTGSALDTMDGIGQLVKAYCCRPQSMPAEWGECFEQGIFSTQGWSTCDTKGGHPTAMVGLRRSSGDSLESINKAKCCAFPDIGLVPSPPLSEEVESDNDFHRRRRSAWDDLEDYEDSSWSDEDGEDEEWDEDDDEDGGHEEWEEDGGHEEWEEDGGHEEWNEDEDNVDHESNDGWSEDDEQDEEWSDDEEDEDWSDDDSDEDDYGHED
eukprot:gnl/TRDRNA2_/TRDRNA2_99617_c1_seq1.p1 gnl/TRDRNA2_/TRDRNA2_99617_c1~~gnl/TRDRNA2_/TRDRNA2_99617_c1_seq1.p1  ORF type:complete len:458 (-),score=98.79 gnl/TRDRNA2_/TRDRNA2_99617_c1_seq1:272-1489(-)